MLQVLDGFPVEEVGGLYACRATSCRGSSARVYEAFAMVLILYVPV